MSYCKNCGANVGDNKFCANCGTAVDNPVTNATNAATNANTYSDYYSQICEYARNATSILVFGILSIVCSMGIGLIFEIICIAKSNKANKLLNILNGNLNLTNPVEIDMLASAKKKHKTGATLASIALIITGVLLFILVMGLAVGAQL